MSRVAKWQFGARLANARPSFDVPSNLSIPLHLIECLLAHTDVPCPNLCLTAYSNLFQQAVDLLFAVVGALRLNRPFPLSFGGPRHVGTASV